MVKLFIFSLLFLPLFGDWNYYTQGKVETLTPLTHINRNTSTAFFKTTNNQIVGVDRCIILKPKSKACKEKILQKYSRYNELPNGDIVLFVKNPKEVFTYAKKIYEEGCVLFAHPDFLITPHKRSFDPLFNPLQWNLNNYGQYHSVPNIDLNVYEAWQYANGEGVEIALIDNGFDFSHPDLKGAFNAQIDLVDYDNDASFDNNYELHGTACAGIIAARKNGIGMQGIAYDASLIGIKLIGSYADGSDKALYVSSIVRAFLYAEQAGADVINCSWGTYNAADAVIDVINDLSLHGRGGKGIPIVFASGNDGRGQAFWMYDESALPSVIAVGAVDNFGELAWYSNYGPALDFVAPSGGGTLAITTTDISGAFGYADGSFGHPDYCYATDKTGFNGTSAAAPQVTGVIALMLQRNPELTKDEVVAILKRTARKIGDTYYDENGHSDYFGYGLVDAEAAVREAIRLKVLRDIGGRSFPLLGFFARVGDNKFDWVYLARGDRVVAKLQGMDENGFLQWKILHIDANIADGVVTFAKSSSSDPFIEKLSGRSFGINGYFIHYGDGAYKWIYIDSVSLRCYKLEHLSYEGNFLWIPLGVRCHIKNGRAIF